VAWRSNCDGLDDEGVSDKATACGGIDCWGLVRSCCEVGLRTAGFGNAYLASMDLGGFAVDEHDGGGIAGADALGTREDSPVDTSWGKMKACPVSSLGLHARVHFDSTDLPWPTGLNGCKATDFGLGGIERSSAGLVGNGRGV
jgi:hypothetical protein